MAFQFPLAAVLGYRRNRERSEELRLLAANLSLSETEAAIADTGRRLREEQRQAKEWLARGITAAEVQFELLCNDVLGHRLAELQQERERKIEYQAECMRAYQQARRNSEVLEAMRQQAHTLYQQQERRREQQRVDELFLLRRNFSSRSRGSD